MSNGWSAQSVDSITLPGGATTGARLVLDGSTDAIYQYDASNNLVGSWAATAGTDPAASTAYPEGFQASSPSTGKYISVGNDPISQNPRINFGGGVAADAIVAHVQTTVFGNGSALYDALYGTSPANSTNPETVGWAADAANTSGTHPASMRLWSTALDFVERTYVDVTYQGAALTGSVTAVEPGTGANPNSPALPETWHTAVLGLNFTSNAGADQVPRYRLEGTGGGICRLDGTVYTSAATAANAVMFTLPAGYAPQNRKRFAGNTNASGYTVIGSTLISVSTAGVVTLTPPASGAGQQVILDGITFPVD